MGHNWKVSWDLCHITDNLYHANFTAIANPLFCMSQKKPIIWTDECSKAFIKLKNRLTSPPVLAFPQKDGGKFILDTDASDYSIGAVLSQLQHGEQKVIV